MQPNFSAPAASTKKKSVDPLCEDLKDLILQPDLIDNFEDRVVCQLVEALLFEEFTVYSKSMISENYCKDFNYHNIYNYKVEFSIANTTLQCIAHFGSFGRIRVAEKSVKKMSSRFYSKASIKDIVNLLSINDEDKDRFLGELTQSILLSRWNAENIFSHKLPARSLHLKNIGAAIHENIHYPHCLQIQTEFSLSDHIHYGLKSANNFQLHWLGIRKSLISDNLAVSEEMHWQCEIGATEYANLIGILERRGGNHSDYSLVPIHPWQLQNLEKPLQIAQKRQDIINLGAVGDHYQASQALQTLINVTQPTKANVKLPLNINYDDSHNHLSKKIACKAPELSSWLQNIIANDSFLQKQGTLLLLSDYAEICIKDNNTENLTAEQIEIASLLEGKIGAIYRQSVLSRLGNNESSVPFTALTTYEPDGNFFITDWLNEYGVERWLSRLLDVCLIPIWHMLCQHGIAFEAQAQNLILIHNQGWPEKIVLRDVHENIIYAEDFLATEKCAQKLAAIKPTFNDNPTDYGFDVKCFEYLREIFMSTTCVYNLADLSFSLDKHCGYSEVLFWKMIKKKLNAYEHCGVTDAAKIKYVIATDKTIAVKSILQNKIHTGSTREHHEHRVSNTFTSSQSTQTRAT